jgi:hypothetical protein
MVTIFFFQSFNEARHVVAMDPFPDQLGLQDRLPLALPQTDPAKVPEMQAELFGTGFPMVCMLRDNSLCSRCFCMSKSNIDGDTSKAYIFSPSFSIAEPLFAVRVDQPSKLSQAILRGQSCTKWPDPSPWEKDNPEP